MAIEQVTDGEASTAPAGEELDETSPPEESAHHNPRFELRCLGCGYGAISAELIRCPMCGDEAWDFAEWRPFSH
jgi:hypothetical protein